MGHREREGERGKTRRKEGERRRGEERDNMVNIKYLMLTTSSFHVRAELKMFWGHLHILSEWAELGHNMRWVLTIDI